MIFGASRQRRAVSTAVAEGADLIASHKTAFQIKQDYAFSITLMRISRCIWGPIPSAY